MPGNARNSRIAAVLLVTALAGCAPPMWVAGHTDDYSEVYTGTGVAGPGANWTMKGLFSGVTCSGSASPTGLFSSTGPVNCSDGRVARVDNRPSESLSYWTGRGTFPDGMGIELHYDIVEDTIRPKLEEFRQNAERRAATARHVPAVVAPAPAPTSTVAPSAVAQPARPPVQPLSIRYPRAPERPDDVAVVIGNADYRRMGRDVPDVPPARADAAAVRHYVTDALGIREGNVIALDDATGAQLVRVFGSKDDPRGQLFDWVKPGRSRVFVYYSGHGAPGREGGSPMLVPVDADAARIELNGYPLKQLYDNLGRLPADSVTVVIEACFSGLSPAGSVLGRASPVFFEVKAPPVPARLTVITAGAANQVASWEPDDSHGLFTRHFLEGMSGKADFDHDGKVSLDELDRHLKDTLTYLARRHYGRDQTAQIVKGGVP
jgi:hypothetical protein